MGGRGRVDVVGAGFFFFFRLDYDLTRSICSRVSFDGDGVLIRGVGWGFLWW